MSPPAGSACSTAITTPSPDSDPLLAVTNLLDAGKLDGYGSEKLRYAGVLSSYLTVAAVVDKSELGSYDLYKLERAKPKRPAKETRPEASEAET